MLHEVEGRALRVVMTYIAWSLGVIVNMETAACFFLGRLRGLAGVAHSGRGRGKGSGCRATSHERFLSCGQTRAQAILIGPAYWEEEPELEEALRRIT